MSPVVSCEVEAEYAALIQGVGVAGLGSRTQIEFTGKDRAAFLHGLCTNDIKRLATGSGCEMFLTNVQGRTVGYGYVFHGAESLVLETSPGQAESICAGLERYIIREDVRLIDRSQQWSELVLAGPDAERCLRQAFSAEVPGALMSHVELRTADGPLSVRRVPFLGPTSFFVACGRQSERAVCAALHAAGAAACGGTALEIARLEAGSPLFGADITSANLPQEVGRDERAISFKKGCYLGQETVARVDALGHVNWRLAGLKVAGPDVPPVGTEIEGDGKTMARVTSAVWSLRLGTPLVLAYVRRGQERVGNSFETPFGPAEVVALPLG